MFAAYNIFENKPSGLPSGFHVVAYIFMYDFLFFARRRQFYGFIATEDADPHSHVLAIRGTEGWWEWFDDAIFVPTSFRPVPEAGPVHSGFYRIYKTMVLVPLRPGAVDDVDTARRALPHPTETFADQLEQLLPADGRQHHFIVTGHSLGAALCTLYVMEHAIKKLQYGQNRQVTIERACTFASPRVGTRSFVDRYGTLPIDSWRIANSQDLVPMVPPEMPFSYRHVESSYIFTSENTTKISPSCWHDIRTYQHWLDPGRPVETACRPK